MKKLNVFLIAALLAAGCATAPTSTVEEPTKKEVVYNEDGVPIPDWALELTAKHEQHMKEKEQELKEYMDSLAKQPKRPAPEEVNKQACKINGHDCWKVLKVFVPGSTASDEQQAAELKKMGLTITESVMYRDGGSRNITLSDGTRVHISNSLWDRSHNMTVKLTNGTTIVYDTDGYQIKPIQ